MNNQADMTRVYQTYESVYTRAGSNRDVGYAIGDVRTLPCNAHFVRWLKKVRAAQLDIVTVDVKYYLHEDTWITIEAAIAYLAGKLSILPFIGVSHYAAYHAFPRANGGSVKYKIVDGEASITLYPEEDI